MSKAAATSSFQVRLLNPEQPPRSAGATGQGGAGKDAVVSPLQGTVLAVEVEEGREVEAGQVLCIVEAMKMENEVHAHRPGA